MNGLAFVALRLSQISPREFPGEKDAILAADRQHRRKTLAQLLAWNAATDGTTVNLEFIGGDIIRPCLVQLFVHWMRLQ